MLTPHGRGRLKLKLAAPPVTVRQEKWREGSGTEQGSRQPGNRSALGSSSAAAYLAGYLPRRQRGNHNTNATREASGSALCYVFTATLATSGDSIHPQRALQNFPLHWPHACAQAPSCARYNRDATKDREHECTPVPHHTQKLNLRQLHPSASRGPTDNHRRHRRVPRSLCRPCKPSISPHSSSGLKLIKINSVRSESDTYRLP